MPWQETNPVFERHHFVQDATSADIVALILDEHTRFGWGARKILKRLRTRDPAREWPARSTIFDILARHDRVRHRRRRQHWKHPGAVPALTTATPREHFALHVDSYFLVPTHDNMRLAPSLRDPVGRARWVGECRAYAAFDIVGGLVESLCLTRLSQRDPTRVSMSACVAGLTCIRCSSA